MNPENQLPFRRMANGSPFTVSSGDGFIAGGLQADGVVNTPGGITDFIRLQMIVDVVTSGSYSVSGDLVDETSGVRLSASQVVTRLTPGSSTVSLFFDRRSLPAGAIAGPFHIENLQLYRRDGDQLEWLDRYQSAFAIQITLYGPPAPTPSPTPTPTPTPMPKNAVTPWMLYE